MKRFPSIKKNSDFQTVYKKGRSQGSKLLVMYVLQTGSEGSRIGISASKKVGNSVVRHRLARLIREVYRLHLSEMQDGIDIVVVARIPAAEATYADIERAYLQLCKKHGLYRN